MAVKPLRKIIQHEAYKIVFWQLAGVFLLAGAALIFMGNRHGISVLAGGLAYGLPNLLFVWRVFRFTDAQQMNRFVVEFFFGEMLKMIVSGILFVLIVKHLPVSLLSVLAGFVGAIVSFWIVCIWHFSKSKGVGR